METGRRHRVRNRLFAKPSQAGASARALETHAARIRRVVMSARPPLRAEARVRSVERAWEVRRPAGVAAAASWATRATQRRSAANLCSISPPAAAPSSQSRARRRSGMSTASAAPTASTGSVKLRSTNARLTSILSSKKAC